MKSRSHKSRPPLFRSRSGFTLIEVIATLSLSAVLMAFLLPLIASGLQGSRSALLRMPETNSLRTEMDAVWHLYRTVYPNDLPALSAAIDTAAAADPPTYLLLDKSWVDFDVNGAESIPPPGNKNILRITLGNSQGERLTTYFFPIP
jgi:prepilin-type N-terminal cleavage/methylation domain-containing protein